MRAGCAPSGSANGLVSEFHENGMPPVFRAALRRSVAHRRLSLEPEAATDASGGRRRARQVMSTCWTMPLVKCGGPPSLSLMKQRNTYEPRLEGHVHHLRFTRTGHRDVLLLLEVDRRRASPRSLALAAEER